jgi:hypothetical protein
MIALLKRITELYTNAAGGAQKIRFVYFAVLTIILPIKHLAHVCLDILTKLSAFSRNANPFAFFTHPPPCFDEAVALSFA